MQEPESHEPVEVAITADDLAWLTDFARSLVEDRICASANITNEVRSFYWWDGRMFDRTEARVILHTRRSRVAAIVERVKAEHTYVVPAVTAVPLIAGNDEYFEWIMRETAGEPHQ